MSAFEVMSCGLVSRIPGFTAQCAPTRNLPIIFQKFLDSFESSIVQLIERTQVISHDLHRMEERLSTIRNVASDEAQMRLLEKAELLADIWTWFGGNRKYIHAVERNLRALRLLFEQHGFADRAISSAQTELRAMQEALEDLRPLASRPLVFDSGFSIDLVMDEIKAGSERVRKRQKEVMEARIIGTMVSPPVLSSKLLDEGI
jgi:hypothetical protein